MKRQIIFAVIISFVLFGVIGFAYALETTDQHDSIKNKPVKKKNIALDLSVGYSQLTDNSKTKFKTATIDIVTTYTAFEDLDVFLGLPYVYGQRTDAQKSTQSNSGIGDINFGLYYQLIDEDNLYISVRPFLIVKTNSGSSPYKATGSEVVSGDGHWSIEGGSGFSKTFNRLRVFSQASYTYFIDETIHNQKNEHGDVIYFHVGTGYQVKKNLDISMQIENSFLGSNKTDGVVTEGNRTAINLSTNIEYDLSPKSSITPSASFGLNKGAEDFSFNITYGYKF